MRNKSTRRVFLGQLGIGLWAVGGARRACAGSSGDKLNVALIGVGGRGWDNFTAMRGENIVALCDVDEAHAGGAFKAMPDVPKFADYRQMFDRMHKQIDAVVISTPDHMHAIMTLAAMQLGKHVYCEKPLTHTVAEARRVAQATAKYKVVTQMGNGGNALAGSRRTVELLRARAIGEVREVHVWTDRPGSYWRNALDRPTDTPPVPKTLHWDLWLGVAQARPYHPAYLPAVWRGWFDFGTGALGDIACHSCNTMFWGLGLRDPTSVEAETSERHKESFPAWSRIKWQFPARDGRGPVTVFWYDGGQKPTGDVLDGQPPGDNGVVFVGDKGRMRINGRYQPSLLPEKDFAGYTPPPKTLPDSPGHHEEWIRNCKNGDLGLDYMSHFGRAGLMTEAVLLGNIPVRTGKRIEWDPTNMKITNAPELNDLLDMPYRQGWKP
ncbi:MAG: Gfo/Idh/MocA family oxidoreductase [Phycisphaerae bacterium]|nr:Gfo/Idh/MocA family oxidoreductase [Phycisphaerae bacterium]